MTSLDELMEGTRVPLPPTRHERLLALFVFFLSTMIMVITLVGMARQAVH